MTRPRRRQKRERKEGSDEDKGPDSKKSVSSAEESEDKSDSNMIMKLPNIVRATVINRPSKVVRSPYMADIVVEGWKDYKTPVSFSLCCSRGSWRGSLSLPSTGLCWSDRPWQSGSGHAQDWRHQVQIQPRPRGHRGQYCRGQPYDV